MASDDDMVELLRVANEVEAREIESLLQEAGIECSVVSRVETPYPSVGMKDGAWGRVLVPASKRAQAETLVAAYAAAEPLPPEDAAQQAPPRAPEPARATSKPVFGTWVLWAAFLLSALLNVILWMRQNALESSKDREGRVISEVIYGYNLVYPYEYRGYDVSGKHTTSWFDADEDGRTELVVELLRRDLEVRLYDDDKNGHFERTETRRGGTVTLESLDEDGDGLFEVAGVPSGGALGLPLFRDEDGDSLYDVVECDRAGHRIRFDMHACAEKP